jgi:Spy/CpxP family protein refolding chaperone
MTKLLCSLMVAFAFVAAPAYAQDKSADMNMQILRDKLKADKKAVVAANMQLTDAEARAFWPIYDAYQNDLKAINERARNAILAYADAYKAGPISDAAANKLLADTIAIDDAEARLRKDYAARLTQAMPASKAVRYLQIENKIRAAIRYELAAGIPLVK